VLLSEHLGAIIDYGIDELKLSPSLGGLIVTALVLAPEGVGAYRAAVANRMQRAVNICLGSALSTIALTIPAVLIATASMGHSLVIGLTQVESTLLYATLMVSLITFISGRSNLLQGTVHLMLFVSYLFFIIKP
jgi:Ca2+:H+ antiporter